MEASGAEVSAEAKAAIAASVQDYLVKYRNDMSKQGSKSAGLKNQDSMPMDSILPMAVMYYVPQLMETVEFQESYVSMGASLQNFGLLTDKQKKLLKPLKSKQDREKNSEGDNAMFQFAVDDNFFNSFAALFTSIDQSYSARQIMKSNPKSAVILNQLHTTTVKPMLPQLAEEYGENKKLDIMLSPSHSLFLDAFPNSKMSGMYIDKNGNLKLMINVVMNLTVEKTPGNQEVVRNAYLTLVFKMKIKKNDGKPDQRKLIFHPRSLEISQLKVMKGDEEMTSEQMMLQSIINLWFEEVKNRFAEWDVSVWKLL